MVVPRHVQSQIMDSAIVMGTVHMIKLRDLRIVTVITVIMEMHAVKPQHLSANRTMDIQFKSGY